MNLSETAFVVNSDKAEFGARYFTPAEEIPLAGHPTISTIHALIEAGCIKMEQDKKHISLELKAGVVQIEISPDKTGRHLVVMSQMKPKFLQKHPLEKIAELFELDTDDFLPLAPIQTVSTGTPQLMVPLKNKKALRKAKMNVEAYNAYKHTSDFFSPHLFCLEGETSIGATFARHFGVPPDTAEDAFTGSATGGMGAFIWHYNLLSTPQFIAEQGHWMGRPGQARVEVVGPPHDIATVKVGGVAVTVVRGELDL